MRASTIQTASSWPTHVDISDAGVEVDGNWRLRPAWYAALGSAPNPVAPRDRTLFQLAERCRCRWYVIGRGRTFAGGKHVSRTKVSLIFRR
jgi:hypothetical protein